MISTFTIHTISHSFVISQVLLSVHLGVQLLEQVTQDYMEAQRKVEEDNSSTIAECRRQQAFLNELESSYAGQSLVN